ncbi:hypothetical protein [Haloimpatiens lingqiaonensis]|uniref:hypothetical protein n=1 Tax=Haloimpatiens lingqiaonensis TaxID=1380675 RepID=UPI0010FEFFD6|nr:hypothetical protein [Haloimpatiens lingqiaonensis]
MASKKSYSRYFIILQEDERGFGLSSGKAPTGYAKIETKNSKCKISYYVQNLKPDDKYSMLLICGKKGCKSLINIGNMRLDEQGRADVSYEYDEENIGGSNTSVDKIIGAAIARIMDNNVISLMSGFITTDIPKDWKTYNMININDNRELGNIFDSYEAEIERSKETIEDNHKELKASEKSKAKYTKAPENKNFNEKDNREKTEEAKKECTGENKKAVENEDRKEYEEIENKVQINENNQNEQLEINNENIDINKERNKDIEDEINDISENQHHVENIEEINENGKKNSQKITQKNQDIRDNKCDCIEKNQYPMKSMENFFEDLGNGFEKYCDIFPKIHKSVWYKIPAEDIEHMCDMSDYDKYVIMYYPMINYYSYIKDYKHYLVGYKYDENCKIKYIMYAIPGSKSPNCQPFKGKTGFVTWMKSYNLDENQGYWIMFYDFKNYNILIPVKKNK